jgi:hypothetical protein
MFQEGSTARRSFSLQMLWRLQPGQKGHQHSRGKLLIFEHLCVKRFDLWFNGTGVFELT